MKHKVAIFNLDVILKAAKFAKAFYASSVFTLSFWYLLASRINGWTNAVAAEGLSFSFGAIKVFIKSFARSETSSHLGSMKLIFPFLTFFSISLSVCPLKGGTPDRRIYVITPHAQTSTFFP